MMSLSGAIQVVLYVLHDHNSNPHICMHSLTLLFPNMWLLFVYMSKSIFSHNILLLEFSIPLEFFIHHSTNREADNMQME